ncbi:protein disulfide-isomerase A6 [Pseudohyphozyma bogoriensis]|nr:protein disulfide-isomerase A6 [Pseudohyphozyma bogoriensis]
MRFLTTAAVALLALSGVEAATFNSKAVKQLQNSASIKNALAKAQRASMVVAYAPWCGHCKNLGPEFDKAAENLKGLVNFVAVDCDAEHNKAWCGEQGVRGFPTLKFFPGGTAPPEDYQGERKAKAMVDYSTGRMPTFVKRASNLKDLESALLFTSAKTTTPLYKALSTDFHKTIDFHAARDATVGEEGMRAFGVTKVPALVLLKGEEVIRYDGPLKHENLKAWFAPHAEKPKASPKPKKDEL